MFWQILLNRLLVILYSDFVDVFILFFNFLWINWASLFQKIIVSLLILCEPIVNIANYSMSVFRCDSVSIFISMFV
jgi:hypothetical protein